MANVIPLPKTKPMISVETDIRPISLTHIVAKVFESTVEPLLYSLGGYESRWKIEFGFEYFTGNHERRHLEEGISISFACTVYMY